MDGCIFCIKRASVMDNLLWLNSVNNIFRVVYKVCSGEWQVVVGRACCFGPPDTGCIVRRRERIVVVIPMWILLRCSVTVKTFILIY